ncbi:hypothetical protein [Paraburkholderia sp. MM5384-R2]|uniref:hypothetical protein n=1 Tax=Paraburkholderia sp. MM5384-R2 TaxID=2723097 RepID=UPI0016160CD5|nr:hypothetical protein [Paraburkholderia sp. MM5384-R2]MBB5498572.1 hypothetical protein [Paraburkholderia sp. MM5384-R2]
MTNHQVAKALYDEVKNGNLLFVPERDDMRKCVEAIRKQREKGSGPAPARTQQPAEADMASSLLGNSPRVPQNLGNAKPLEYAPDALSGDVQQIAARGVSAAEETECDAIYHAEMTACSAAGAIFQDPRTYALCAQRAFANYQTCRGY